MDHMGSQSLAFILGVLIALGCADKVLLHEVVLVLHAPTTSQVDSIGVNSYLFVLHDGCVDSLD